MNSRFENGMDYKSAGVDIEAGNQLVERIKPMASRTSRVGVLGGLGGFGSLFELPLGKYENPVLVAGTDGVGTKLKLAIESRRHNGVGVDLVAMCVNDIVVQGAEPLFFLDYYASSHLDVDVASEVIDGIAKGCELAGCALVGGETAEMPGLYQKGDYDLAGFCVGIVEKSRIIDGSMVKPSDRLLGLASSGPHSNGFSLIRKILEKESINVDGSENQELISWLLEPTRIYVKNILALMKQVKVHAIAHITGGGITENLPRVLPAGTSAIINLSAWERSSVFQWLRDKGKVAEDEMLKTFNCGIGMILCVSPGDEDETIESLSKMGETVYRIGEIVESAAKPHVKYVDSW